MIQRPLPVYHITALKDEQVPDTLASFPGGAGYAAQVFDACPVVLSLDGYTGQQRLGYSSGDDVFTAHAGRISVRQLSVKHGRSFEVVDKRLPTVWHDEYSQPYGSLNLKGNNFSDTRLMQTATASEGLTGYGLQESSSLRRVLRGSRLLLGGHISTEKFLGIAEPVMYPSPEVAPNVDVHANLTLDEYKQKLVMGHWQELRPAEQTAERLAELTQKFERMTFYITLRAMDTSYRLGELRNRAAREHAFTVANCSLKPVDAAPYNVDNPKDTDRLLREVTIPRAAVNMARMHCFSVEPEQPSAPVKKGLAHRFPNDMNITALGSYVDLDSLHGEPLGLDDEPITAEDIANDLAIAMTAVSDAGSREQAEQHRTAFLEAYTATVHNNKLTLPHNLAKVAFATYKIVTDDDYDIPLIFSNSLQKSYNLIIDTFSDKKLQLETSVPGIAEKWLTEQRDKIIKLVPKTLVNDLDGIVSMVMSTARDYITGPGFNCFDFIRDPNVDNHIFNHHVDSIVAECIAQVFTESDAFKTLGMEADELVTWQVKTIFLENYIGQQIYQQAVEQFYSDYSQEIMKRTTVTAARSLLGDGRYDSQLLFPSRPPLFAMETAKVPVVDLHDYLFAHPEIPLWFSTYKASSSTSDENSSHSLSTETNTLTELITDGYIDMIGYGVEYIVEAVSVEKSPYATYIAYVEDSADGHKSVHVQVIPLAGEPEVDWQKLSRNEALTYLIARYEKQGKLFDDHELYDHDRSQLPKFGIFLAD